MQNSIIPKDKLYKMRMKNLEKSIERFEEYGNDKLIGVVFINKKFLFLPNITWITHSDYRNKGIATRLTKRALKYYYIMSAKTRNNASRRIAEKSGFIELIRNYWIHINLKPTRINTLFITRA